MGSVDTAAQTPTSSPLLLASSLPWQLLVLSKVVLLEQLQQVAKLQDAGVIVAPAHMTRRGRRQLRNMTAGKYPCKKSCLQLAGVCSFAVLTGLYTQPGCWIAQPCGARPSFTPQQLVFPTTLQGWRCCLCWWALPPSAA